VNRFPLVSRVPAAYGTIATFKGDNAEYQLQPGQYNLPHENPLTHHHKFKGCLGMAVIPGPYHQKYLGLNNIEIIADIRDWQAGRHTREQQVRLYGRPGNWYNAYSFKPLDKYEIRVQPYSWLHNPEGARIDTTKTQIRIWKDDETHFRIYGL